MKKTCIHYGHSQFDIGNFDPIVNQPFFPKPKGGLWASAVDAAFGWKDWNKDANLRECSEDNAFTFTLTDDAKVLVIDNAEVLQTLDDSLREIRGDFRMVLLDFEKLVAEAGYDAIEYIVSQDRQLYWTMYGWDCDSLLVLNPRVIEPGENENV